METFFGYIHRYMIDIIKYGVVFLLNVWIQNIAITFGGPFEKLPDTKKNKMNHSIYKLKLHHDDINVGDLVISYDENEKNIRIIIKKNKKQLKYYRMRSTSLFSKVYMETIPFARIGPNDVFYRVYHIPAGNIK